MLLAKSHSHALNTILYNQDSLAMVYVFKHWPIKCDATGRAVWWYNIQSISGYFF